MLKRKRGVVEEEHESSVEEFESDVSESEPEMDDESDNEAPLANLPMSNPLRASKQQSRDVSYYVNKQRTLVLCSRGVSHRDRHFMKDLLDLLPHSKRDSKLDTKNTLSVINELAEMKACSSCLFLESRKRQDLYLWMSKTPNGPCVKFLVQNSVFTLPT